MDSNKTGKLTLEEMQAYVHGDQVIGSAADEQAEQNS
jgi:hypothetical protein